MSPGKEIELRNPEVDLPETVMHGGVSVTFVHPESLKKRLEQTDEITPLLDCDKDDLPDPCTEASLWYHYEEGSDNGNVQLAAAIAFNAPDNPIDRHVWQSSLRGFLDKQLTQSGVDTAKLDHHQTTLYAQLDDTYATQFSLTETVDSYCVEMKLEHISAIMSAQIINEDSLPPDHFDSHTNTHNVSTTPPYELVRRFTHHWAVALSSIKKRFGSIESASGISTFIVNVPERIESSPIAPGETPEDEAAKSERPETTFEDIGGAFEAKEQLRPIAYAFLHPELANHYGIHPTSFMLHGPEGTGKTSLVHAFANMVGAELREYSSADIVSKWVGKSGKHMEAIFKSAKETTEPLVLFFDEFDSIAPKGDAGSSERRDVKNTLKRQLSIIAKHYPNIIVAAATNNDPYDFDGPLLRAGRLQPIPVFIPTDVERMEIWQLMMESSVKKLDPIDAHLPETMTIDTLSSYTPAKQPVYGTDIDITALAQATTGFTGADIEEVLLRARQKAFVTAVETDTIQTLSHDDIMVAIRRYQKV